MVQERLSFSLFPRWRASQGFYKLKLGLGWLLDGINKCGEPVLAHLNQTLLEHRVSSFLYRRFTDEIRLRASEQLRGAID